MKKIKYFLDKVPEEVEQDKIGFGFLKNKIQKSMYKISYMLGRIIWVTSKLDIEIFWKKAQ